MTSLLWALARGPGTLGHSDDTVTVTGGARGIGASVAVAWAGMMGPRLLYVADAAAFGEEAYAVAALCYTELPHTSTTRTGVCRQALCETVEHGEVTPSFVLDVDVLINCVSMSSPTAMEDAEFRSRGILPKMIARKTGILVNIVVAEKGPAYTAAEGALQKLTDALRKDVGSSPVRIVQALVRVAPGHAHAAAAHAAPPAAASVSTAEGEAAVPDWEGMRAAHKAAAERTVAVWRDAGRSIVNRVICGRHNIAIDSDAPPDAEGDAAAAGGAGAPA